MAFPQPIASAREYQLDSKLLVRALIELNIARKNLLSYPAGHHQVTASIQRAFQHLKSFLAHEKELSFGVLKDGLSVSGIYLEPGNAVFADLAACLRERRIAAVTFSSELSKDDTVSFLQLITREAPGPEAAGAGEDLPVRKIDLKSVRVHFVDYGKFHHTVGDKVSKRPAPEDSGPEGSIWVDYARYLAADAITESPDGMPIVRSQDLTPGDLADYVNSHAASDRQMLKSYARVIQDHLQRASVSPVAKSANHRVQEKFRQFIEDLNPNLRKQFLSITFDQWQQHADQLSSAPAFDHLPYSIAIDMLDQANREGKEISPSLLNFVRKFGGIQQTADGDAAGADLGDALQELLRRQPPNAAGGIFRREKYEDFVVADYDRTLQSLIPDQGRTAPARPDDFELDRHLGSLSEERLTARLAEALLGLLEQETDTATYREHAGNLLAIAPEVAEHGDFALLIDIYKKFQAHAGGRYPEIGAVARGCIDRLRHPQLINVILNRFFRDRHPLDKTLGGMLLAMGPDIVPLALSQYLAQKSPSARHLLDEVAAAFPFRVSSELSRLFKNAGYTEFTDLRKIIARLDPRAAATLLRPAMDHADRRIRIGALEALLQQKDPQALGRLEAMLGSRRPAEALTAIDLIGRCSVNESAPALAKMIRERFLWLRADIERNVRIVAALKQLGGPLPRERIERVLKARFTLFPARLRRMKASLKQFLDNGTFQHEGLKTCRSPFKRSSAL
jgi:hypothetical protein